MIKIIPAIDIIDGKCVRLTQGDYNQKKVYNDNPVEVAKAFEDAGITQLHLVDLDGAREKRIINHEVIKQIAIHTDLAIDFGGGLQSDEDVKIAFESGASQITGGSIAVKDEEMFSRWIEEFGPEKIILGADAKDGMIAIGGWQETTEIPVFDLIRKYHEKGLIYTISTDVAKDGMMEGPSFELYEEMKAEFPDMNIIASGGVKDKEDIVKLMSIGVYGVIVGKAYYEGSIGLKDIENINAD